MAKPHYKIDESFDARLSHALEEIEEAGLFGGSRRRKKEKARMDKTKKRKETETKEVSADCWENNWGT